MKASGIKTYQTGSKLTFNNKSYIIISVFPGNLYKLARLTKTGRISTTDRIIKYLV